MQRTEKTKVRLFAPKPVELEPRITLPAGSYNGTSMRIGVQMSQGTNWTTPQYKIEFDAEQLRSMGVNIGSKTISEEWDVSKHVRSGAIEVVD
jgi:hypothetical protein